MKKVDLFVHFNITPEQADKLPKKFLSMLNVYGALKKEKEDMKKNGQRNSRQY